MFSEGLIRKRFFLYARLQIQIFRDGRVRNCFVGQIRIRLVFCGSDADTVFR